MLNNDARTTLDGSLLDLLKLVRSDASHDTVLADARQLIDDYECRADPDYPGRIVEDGTRLLSRRWEATWHRTQSVSWGCFGDINLDQTAKALHQVFRELIRLVLDSNSEYHQQKHRQQLESVLCDYLALQGCDVAVPSDVRSQGKSKPKHPKAHSPDEEMPAQFYSGEGRDRRPNGPLVGDRKQLAAVLNPKDQQARTEDFNKVAKRPDVFWVYVSDTEHHLYFAAGLVDGKRIDGMAQFHHYERLVQNALTNTA